MLKGSVIDLSLDPIQFRVWIFRDQGRASAGEWPAPSGEQTYTTCGVSGSLTLLAAVGKEAQLSSCAGRAACSKGARSSSSRRRDS